MLLKNTVFTLIFFKICFSAFTQRCSQFIQPRNVSLNKDFLCPEVMLKDLQELREKLDLIHPDLYVYSTKQQLDSAYKASITKVSSELSIFQFAEVIANFLGVIKDSHTSLNPIDLLYFNNPKRGAFPFFLKKIEGKFYIDKIWNDDKLNGKEMLEINGIDLNELYHLSYIMSFTEANATEAKNEIATKSMGLIFNLINDLKIYDSVSIKYVSGNDTLLNINPCTNMRGFTKFKNWVDESPVRFFFDNYNRGILTLSSFEPKSIKFFKREIDNFFIQLDKRNCKDIVIDLRDNHGGYVRAQEYLLSYLNYKKINHEIEYVYKRSDYDRFSLLPFYQKWQFKQRAKKVYPNSVMSKELDFFNSKKGSCSKILYDYLPKNDYNKIYNGKCTLLINGSSMSASVLFAGWFKSSSRGEIIGSPCMGTMSGTFGNSASIRLSGTGLPIIIATLKFNPQHSKNIEYKAIQPDKSIYYTIEDVLLQRDPVFYYLNIKIENGNQLK